MNTMKAKDDENSKFVLKRQNLLPTQSLKDNYESSLMSNIDHISIMGLTISLAKKVLILDRDALTVTNRCTNRYHNCLSVRLKAGRQTNLKDDKSIFKLPSARNRTRDPR